MKIKKILFLSLFFIIGLLLIMPSKVNAIVTLDRVLNIDGSDLVPIIGRTPGILSDGEYYEVVSQIWREENGTLLTGNFEEGKNYTYELTIKQKEGYEFSDDVFFNFKNIEWLEHGHGVSNSEGIAFFSGKCKSVKIHKLTITSDEGIDVSPVGTMDIYTGYSKEIVLKNNKGYDLKSVKINGEERIALVEFREIEVTPGEFSFVNVLTVDCMDSDIKVVVESIKVIENVEITGAVIPKVGHYPVVDGLRVPANANYEITSACWGTYDGLDEYGPEASFNEMLSGESFEEGKYYALKVVLRSNDEKIGFGLETLVTMNGLSVSGVVDDYEIEVYVDFWRELKLNYFLNNTENQEFIMGTDENLIFILDFNRNYGKVFVDDKELSEENRDYVWDYVEGIYPSISLSKEYIQTLELGKHTIKFIFYNGMETETTFTIVENKNIEDDKQENIENEVQYSNSNTENTNTNKPTGNNPQTSDDLILFVIIFAISIIGVTATTLMRKKEKSR